MTIAAVTMSGGLLFRTDDAAKPPPLIEKPEELAPTTAKLAVFAGHTVAFARGSSTLEAAAHNDLDVFLATHRRLFGLAGWYRLVAGASPEFVHGSLQKKQADDQNRALARFRARNVINAIQASIGQPGQGIVHPEKEVDEAVDTTSQVRESVSPSEGDDTSVLHPHSDAAKSSDGKATVQREQREKYAFLRRVDLVVNGVLAVTLPGR